MNSVNELEHEAKQEYFLILGLMGLGVIIGITTSVLLVVQFMNSGVVQITQVIMNYFPIYTILLTCLSLVFGTIIWRSYRIPPKIKKSLTSYYTQLGYQTRARNFRKLKVIISPSIFFTLKLKLYNRASDESCLFKLTSMEIPQVSRHLNTFQQIAERHFLTGNIHLQKFSTVCEMEEIHTRSLLLIQALEQFLKNTL